jgi:parallel beta-helix repeat protein
MKKLFNMFLALSLLFCFFHPAQKATASSNTYYVDPGGSNTSGDGSLAHPWKTIAFGVTQLAAGDTLLINPGTYTDYVYLDTSGTASAPITIRANSPGVIIDGTHVTRDAFFIENADYIIVDGLTIQNAPRAGMRLSYSNHVSVRNCIFANNGDWGFFTDFSDYTLVENCESYGAIRQHGIYISNSSDYPTIRHNRLHNNYGCGLHMNGDASMGGDGIISHGLVEDNIIYENGLGGGSGINMDGVTDTIVRNNLLYDNHASGISMYQIDGGSGSQNNRVLNNTILMPANGRWAINIPDTNDTNNIIFNNILYSDHAFRGSISIPGTALAGFESDYNVVVSRFSADGGDTNMSLSSWQSLGYDQHSLIATPGQLFINPATKDFHLTPGSPAIDKGTGLPDVTDDLEGNPRPFGPQYDIGAYEFIPALTLYGAAGNHLIRLTWSTFGILAAGVTWQISYTGPTGDQDSPITGLAGPTREYTLTGLANDTWYTIVLNAMLGSAPILTDTVQVMPVSNFIYMPYLSKTQ